MKSVIVGLCGLFLAGCSSVTMKKPFPESALTQKEQNQLAGSWRIDELVLHVAFAGNGVPWLATVEWKNDDFQLQKYRLRFTKRNGALYVSMPTEPNGGQSEYFFAEIKRNSHGINVWLPDTDVFAELIKASSLAGKIETNDHTKKIHLESPAADILELIATNPATLQYKNPILLQRLD